jgi:hypothetical protein
VEDGGSGSLFGAPIGEDGRTYIKAFDGASNGGFATAVSIAAAGDYLWQVQADGEIYYQKVNGIEPWGKAHAGHVSDDANVNGPLAATHDFLFMVNPTNGGSLKYARVSDGQIVPWRNAAGKVVEWDDATNPGHFSNIIGLAASDGYLWGIDSQGSLFHAPIQDSTVPFKYGLAWTRIGTYNQIGLYPGDLTVLTPAFTASSTPPVPSSPPVPYRISLDSFQISNTRSRHTDTDFVDFSIRVGDHVYPSQTRAMGDLNNGTYPVGLSYGPIEVASGEPVVIMYTIVNAGNHPELNQAVLDAFDQINLEITKAALAYADIDDDNLASLLASTNVVAVLNRLALGGVLGLVNPDCDGIVASDVFGVTSQQLATWTASGPHAERRTYPGTDSPSGCGSNSLYSVTWSVQRQ